MDWRLLQGRAVASDVSVALAGVVLTGFASGIVLAGFASATRALAEDPVPLVVPKATCGPNDHPETALQGQVPAALRAAGFHGFNCNLELISQSKIDAANWQTAEFREAIGNGADQGKGHGDREGRGDGDRDGRGDGDRDGRGDGDRDGTVCAY